MAAAPAVMSAQTPTSFDMANMASDDPAVTARKALSNARKGLRKAEKLEAKGKDPSKIEKELRDSLAEAEHALALDPVLAEARVTLGQVLLRLGRTDEAMETCVLAVRWAPELVHGQACQAMAQIARGNPTAALPILQSIEANEKADPQDAQSAAGSVQSAIAAWKETQLDEAAFRTSLREWITASY